MRLLHFLCLHLPVDEIVEEVHGVDGSGQWRCPPFKSLHAILEASVCGVTRKGFLKVLAFSLCGEMKERQK